MCVRGAAAVVNLVKEMTAPIEAVESDFRQVLVAAASGGVWKSVNAGTTWKPIFDHTGVASIGDIAIFQKDPNVIWVGKILVLPALSPSPSESPDNADDRR